MSQSETRLAPARPLLIVLGLESCVVLLSFALDGPYSLMAFLLVSALLVTPSALGVWWWRRVRSSPSLRSSLLLHGGGAAVFVVLAAASAGLCWLSDGQRPPAPLDRIPGWLVLHALYGFSLAAAEGVARLGRWLDARMLAA